MLYRLEALPHIDDGAVVLQVQVGLAVFDAILPQELQDVGLEVIDCGQGEELDSTSFRRSESLAALYANRAAGVNLPPDFCRAFPREGKQRPRHTSLSFSSRITPTYFSSMIRLKLSMSIFFMPSVKGTVP